MFGKTLLTIRFRKVEKNIRRIEGALGYTCSVISDEYLCACLYEVAADYDCIVKKIDLDSWHNTLIIKCKKKDKNAIAASFLKKVGKEKLRDVEIE